MEGNAISFSNLPHRIGSAIQNPFAQLQRPTHSRIKQIWVMGGGKGGVGKSLLASSLSIGLSRLGNRVTAIDLDLGGANLHTTMGVELPKQTLNDYLSGRVADLEACVVSTPIPHLNLISGAQDAVSAAGISFEKKTALLQEILRLDTDYIVLDLGAGTSEHTLDFFLFADIGLLALLPEPTSIENAYRFVKSTYYRRLLFSPNLAPIAPLIEMVMDVRNPMGIKNPADLYREVNLRSPEMGMRLKEEIARIRPKLILNQARTQPDIEVGSSVKTVCKKYFGIDIDYLGYLEYESSVWQAVRRKRPLMNEFPNSRLVSSIERIASLIIKKHGDQRNTLY